MQIQPVASHFINGEYVEDTSAEHRLMLSILQQVKCIGCVYGATDAVIEQAIDSVSEARAERNWANTSGNRTRSDPTSCSRHHS